MAKNNLMFWTYLKDKPKRDYIDPRILIARQIGWQKLAGNETPFSVPEPDNYNRAVLTDKPVECRAVENQVIYKDANKQGWVTVLYVTEDELQAYNRWLATVNPRAHWQHTRPPRLKEHRVIPL
jgi:hypothetical protein